MAARGMTTISQTTTPGISTARSIMKIETAKYIFLKFILTEIFAALAVPQILTVNGASANVMLASSRSM